MKRFPYIDRLLPADASPDMLRLFYEVIYPGLRGEEIEFAREVLLAMEALPDEIREELQS